MNFSYGQKNPHFLPVPSTLLHVDTILVLDKQTLQTITNL